MPRDAPCLRGLPVRGGAVAGCVLCVLAASCCAVAATSGGGTRDGPSSQDEEEELPAWAAVAAAGVRVMPDCFGCLLNLLMGSSQCPERAFRIWKCLLPGEGSMRAPPRPKNQISPVLQRMRASLRSKLWMPMRPGTPDFSRHGATNFSSKYCREVSCNPAVKVTSY